MNRPRLEISDGGVDFFPNLPPFTDVFFLPKWHCSGRSTDPLQSTGQQNGKHNNEASVNYVESCVKFVNKWRSWDSLCIISIGLHNEAVYSHQQTKLWNIGRKMMEIAHFRMF